jgi:hypothetical protein
MPEPFSNHKNQSKLYTKYMGVSHACLLEVIREMYGPDEYKIACITFIHTHSRSGEYKPHLHTILGEGALHMLTGKWRPFKYIPMDVLKLSWKKHLLIMMRKEFPELNIVAVFNAMFIRSKTEHHVRCAWMNEYTNN